MNRTRNRVGHFIVAALVAAGVATAANVPQQGTVAATDSPGFRSVEYARDLLKPTAMDFAPDGRLFINQKEGKVRMVGRGGVLRDDPVLDIEAKVDSYRERGLLGIELDPNFLVNGHIFIFYSSNVGGCHHVVSRFTMTGQYIDPASEVELLDLGTCGSGGHNGGAIHNAIDGTLMINAGEQNRNEYAMDKAQLFGKVLRINRDGTIPADNPFYDELQGKYRAIYATGLRNPFSGGVDPVTGDYFVNDVGHHEFEEINHVQAGDNLGWPWTEGDFDPVEYPDYTAPVHAFAHGEGEFEGCAIVGGTFYRSDVGNFPADFQGDWLYADYCNAYIHRLDRATGEVTSLATDVELVADIDVGPDGNIYYLDRQGGPFLSFVHKMEPSNLPGVFKQPGALSVNEGEPAIFRVVASGNGPHTFQWFRDGVVMAGETERVLEIDATVAADHDAQFHVEVSNDVGAVESKTVALTVIADTNAPPTVTIDSPIHRSQFRGSDEIAFSATAADAEDGDLPDSAYRWEIVFHHAEHTHPFVESYVGRSGSLTVPANDHTEADIYYRFHVTVTDSNGVETTTSVDVLPKVVRIRMLTEPPGLPVLINGQPKDTFFKFDSVTGVQQQIGAPLTASKDGVNWVFDSWFGATPDSLRVTTAPSQQTYTANYRVAGGEVGVGTGLLGTYFNNADFTDQKITRRDRVINFVWRNRRPHSSIDRGSFSAIWSGEIMGQFSEDYEISAIVRGDVKITIGDEVVIDGSTSSRKRLSGNVSLVAGERVPITVEYANPTLTGIIELNWSSPSTPESPIPRSQLS